MAPSPSLALLRALGLESAGVRILLVSDLHYSLKQFDWLVSPSTDYDLMVVAGDSLDVAALPPLDAQSVVILEYLSLLQHFDQVGGQFRQP